MEEGTIENYTNKSVYCSKVIIYYHMMVIEIRGIVMSNFNLNFKYKFDEDYNPLYINGVYGGVSPRGELVLNFYLERQSLPYEEQSTFDEDGNLIEVIVKPENRDINIIRYIQNGVVMNTETALAMKNWIDAFLKSQTNITEE